MAGKDVPPTPRRLPSARAARTSDGPTRAAPKTAPASVSKPSGPLAVGDLLAERYLLLEAIASPGPGALWRAHDEVLARPVAVKVLATPNKAARDGSDVFLEAAVRSGAVNHPGIVRVYDAALESRPGRGNDVAYLVSEWIDGEPLDVHLDRVGGLASVDAADVLRQAADALTAAHARGVTHGRVHPGNVLITSGGRVRLTDAVVAAALQRDAAAPQEGTPAAIADDTRDLAAVLYALLTTRWPAASSPQPSRGLSPAAVEAGQQLTTRQLKAAVPRALDTVVTRGLEPDRIRSLSGLRTPAQLADATDSAVSELRTEQLVQETTERKPPGRLRRSLPWLAAIAFVTAVAVAGWLVGLAVGELPHRQDTIDAISTQTTAPSPGTTSYPALVLAKVKVTDFDPQGKDHSENPDQVPNATDGQPGTAWTTSAYKTDVFSGIKQGVGLLLDLGKPTALHTVQVAFTAPGAHVDVRVSGTEPTDPNAMKTVCADNKGDELASMRPLPDTKSRYVLIWITQLPKLDKTFRVGISELRLT